MSAYQLNAETREGKGTGVARALRRNGKVPGVVYGKNFEPIKVAVEAKEMNKIANRTGWQSKLFELNVDGKKHKVLTRDIQLHPVTDVVESVDFMRVSDDQEIRVFVPVSFINQDKSTGLKRGGALNVVRHEIEFYCLPSNIPANIVVDLTGTKIGNSIHIESVTLPSGVRPVIDRNFTIATIAGKSGKDDDAAESEEAGAAKA